MFRSYLKIALRNLRKYKAYSAINITGLAIGMACCLLILLYVQYELSYDQFHQHADRIYRVTREWFNADGESNLHLGHVAPPIGPLLANDFPNLEQVTRLLEMSALVNYREKYFQEDQIFMADENVFKIFTFPFIKGDPANALAAPNAVVITETVAQKYFPEEDPLNKELRFDFRGTPVVARVTGVTRDVPQNSHMHYNFLISFLTYESFATDLNSWGSNNYATYILLPENETIEKIESQIPRFIADHHPDGPDAVSRTTLHFQPLTSIHLHSHLDSEIEPNGDIANVYIFSIIALLVLLIACINFMNLATARSARRAKEVGLRKVVGAYRGQLIKQFLGESLLLAILSLLLAILLAELWLPTYNNFIGKTLSLNIGENLFLLMVLAGITVLVGIIAGSYPAFYLSAFEPVTVLKEVRRGASGEAIFRKMLVIAQFTISITLLIAVGVVFRQLKYINNKQLGYDKERVVVLPSSPEIVRQFPDFRNRLLNHPGILNVSIAKRVPSGRLLDSWEVQANYAGTDQPIDFRIAGLVVDHNYLDTYGIPLVAGRNFSRDLASDSTEAFILNETAVRRIGWKNPEEAVGQPLGYGGRNGRIIGVVRDFHFESLRNKISPICLMIAPFSLNQVSVKIAPHNIPAVLKFLEEQWRIYRPNYSFEYQFLDERLHELYQSEKKLMEIFGYFSLLAVFIACLGLFGLASFSAEQRTKEIGIRKVLGASVSGITLMLSRQFSGYVLLANLIAWPVAYYAMNHWLQGFAYHSNISVGIFVLAGTAALTIAILTVSYQAVKAALTNPVQALRYE